MRLSHWAAQLALLATLGCGPASARPLTQPDVQTALREAWLPTHPGTRPQAIEMDDTEARRLVARHLDKRLLKAVRRVEGWTFTLTPSGAGGTPDIGVMLLDYSDARTAARQHERLSRQSGHFKHTKVLTPIASAATGQQVVIVFTEKAANTGLARLVQALPGELQARQRGPAISP